MTKARFAQFICLKNFIDKKVGIPTYVNNKSLRNEKPHEHSIVFKLYEGIPFKFQGPREKSSRSRPSVLCINPIPTRLCHVIYCCGDKNYPCLVGIEFGILLPKLSCPTVRKNCSSDGEKNISIISISRHQTTQ